MPLEKLLMQKVCECASDFKLSLHDKEFAKLNGGGKIILAALIFAVDEYEKWCDENLSTE